MAVFMVIVDRQLEAVKERLDKNYPNAYYPYHNNDRVFFVASSDIAEKIAVNLGIKGENKIDNMGGAVFRLNSSYAGYTQNALWDWLSQNDE